MKKYLIIKQPGPSFKIPVNDIDSFTKDAVKADDEDFENRITEQQQAQAWSEFEAEIRSLNYENGY